MKNIEVIEFHELDKVFFYTIVFDGENSEVDKFLDKFPEGCEYEDDFNIILAAIEKIGENGAELRDFRLEGNPTDDVNAIPIQSNKIRLYCIFLNENIIILGNGKIKNTRTYNEDPELESYVKALQKIDYQIKKRIESGKISVLGKQLYGNLKFKI